MKCEHPIAGMRHNEAADIRQRRLRRLASTIGQVASELRHLEIESAVKHIEKAAAVLAKEEAAARDRARQ